jgi:hypothetical protein
MGLNRWHTNETEIAPNGAVIHRNTVYCMPFVGKVGNCPCGEYGRRMVYLPDPHAMLGWSSQAAAIRIKRDGKEKVIKGALIWRDDGPAFNPWKEGI